MIKTFLTAIFAIISFTAAQAQQPAPRPMNECATLAPHGFPQINLASSSAICRHGYALLHDNRARVAAWVVYTIHAPQTLSCLPRQDAFAADQSLPAGGRSELNDFRRSGYDMGHIAPNGDMSWDQLVQQESFILSNIAPQLPGLNRGLWRELEAAVRVWAYTSQGSLTIYAGSIYSLHDPRIGSGVIVPRAFYKIIINNQTRETLAFLFPHRGDVGGEIIHVQTTVSEIEHYTGIVFPVPDNKLIRRNIWPVNGRGLLAARQAQCRR